jgi:hypothetical protein
MSPAAAAWIRTHAWTPAMLKVHKHVPQFHSHCACQHGETGHCSGGQHRACVRGEPLPSCETYICGTDGQVLHLPEPFEHPSPSATGARRERAAMVWLADRVCKWRCPCSCHRSQIPGRPDADVGETLDLFAE